MTFPMPALLLQLLPIFVYFGLGLWLKHAKVADKSHGDFLLRFVFFVTLPALILTTVPVVELTATKVLLPVLNAVINLICLCAMWLIARVQPHKQLGTALVNAGIHNNSFMFPFIIAVYGQAGFADAVLYDLGNALWMATALYLLAFWYSGEQHDPFTMLKRIVKSPLIWSLGVSIVLSITTIPLPKPLITLLNPLGQMTAPLILIALGLYFSLSISNLKLAMQIVGVRMVVGLAAGVLLAAVIGAEGLTRTVIILCSAAPIGFTALTYSSMAKLDAELSASAVSISIIAGLIGIPILIILLG